MAFIIERTERDGTKKRMNKGREKLSLKGKDDGRNLGKPNSKVEARRQLIGGRVKIGQ